MSISEMPTRPDAGENDPAGPDPIDHYPGNQSKGQASDQKSKQKALRELRPRESQRIGQRGIKNREAIKNDADGEE